VEQRGMAQGSVEDTYRDQGKGTPPYGMPSLSRLATWGTLATVSLGLAIISAHWSASRPTAAGTRSEQSSTSAAEPGEADANTRRLIEAVRVLAADREQLLTRMASLERNLTDVTGSIKRDVNAASQRPLPQITSTSSVAGGPAADAPASPPEMPPSPAAAAANVPASTPAASPPRAIQAADIVAPDLNGRGAAAAFNPVRNAPPAEPMTAELGIDVGGALNFDSLLTLWSSIKRSNLVPAEELYPLVALRENNRLGVDLRLIIGPLAGAEAAARLCSTLSAEHRYCQPVAFEGQRLSSVKPAPKVGTVSVRRPASGPSQPQKPQ
jgi:hypothetical protein